MTKRTIKSSSDKCEMLVNKRYMQRRVTRLYILLATFLFIGCSSVVTNEPFVTELANSCFEVKEEFNIFAIDQIPYDSYIVSTKESFVLSTYFEERYKIVAKVRVNETIKITEVIHFSDGANGHCWKVFFSTMNFPNARIELPSCWSHSSSLWISPETPSERDKTGEDLKIDTKYLKRLKHCI
ncbi:hypothetical protein [Flavobacterium sp. W21_SRS_FM6]|uniref:hypothetical protein n=1 Tax=Flavobacterium sp. W21_SRS_FM6 TaxID=3240268 RepID=UPI003F909A10